MTDEEIAQTLGFDDVEQLYASELWRMWTSNVYGDSYWIKLLQTIEAGDRLYATERLGYLQFAKVNGKMTISTVGGGSDALWDWQGAGLYTIGRFESDRDNARLSDEVFSGAAGFHRVYSGFGDLDQPLYCYDVGPRGGITVEYLGYRIISRTPGVNFASTTGLISGGHSGWKWGLDMGLTAASYFIPGYGYVKTAKLAFDLTLTVINSAEDPVYHYQLEFGLPVR